MRARLEDYAGEVVVGARMLPAALSSRQRVLELGGGLGLLSIWLASQGIEVTLLEPGAGGFDDNASLLSAVQYFGVQLPRLTAACRCASESRIPKSTIFLVALRLLS